VRNPLGRYDPRPLAATAAVVVAFAAAAGGAGAYISATGAGTASAGVSSLTSPGDPHASVAASSVNVAWTASTIGVAVAAGSYTVERYSPAGADLGEASCATVPSSAGLPDAFGEFSCTDSPSMGTFKYRITAHYRSWFASSGFTESVSLAASATALASTVNPARPNQQVSYTATVTVEPSGTPTGKVRFLDGANTIAGCAEQPLSASSPYRASCDVAYGASGSHSITARYISNGTYPNSTSAMLTQTIAKGIQSISFEGLKASRTLDEGPITVKATASSGLPVTYESKSTGVCVTSGGSGETVSFLTAGACTIEATQAGSEEWAAATEEQSFAVTPTASLTALSPASVEAGEDTTRVVVSPDDHSVYATNGGAATISQYSRNTETGKLTALSPATVSAGDAPEDAVVSPDGANVYVANRSSNTLSQYARNITTGALTPLGSVAAGEGPIGLTSSPDGKSVYATNSSSETVSQYSRNAETGKLTALSPATVAAGTNAHAVVVSPDGKSAYVANYGLGTVAQYSRNTETGKLSVLSPATVPAGINPHGIAISPGGESVYVANNSSPGAVTLLTRNTTSGKLTTSTAMPAGEYSECVVVSPDGENVYATNEVSGSISQYSRNTETGKLTTLSPATIATGIDPSGIAISADGKSLYTADLGSDSISQYARSP
jgi:DNA-binding beta-propeller fold protein YncE